MGIGKLKEKINSLPLTPGVYIMKSAEGEILYVGKAASLRKRLRSYCTGRVSAKTGMLLGKVATIDYVSSDTEEQALLLEAALIKEKQPKYNIALRDDKSYPYVVITHEEFPRVFIARPKRKTKDLLFGPFPRAKLLKASLQLIRKIFPYCSCKRWPKKPCLYYHLRLCPAPCSGEISPAQYRENIQNIVMILRGERMKLIALLRKRMEEYSRVMDFEGAARIRNQLLALENLYHGKRVKHVLISLKEILSLPSLPLIIEAIDISNISGYAATGSVVVFRDGAPDKNSYRRYRIKGVEKIDDYAMIGEVVRRRYKRLSSEGMALPDLVVIDGGRGHLARAQQELKSLRISLPLIGIAKKHEEVWVPGRKNSLRIPQDTEALYLIQKIRDEAHRFAHSYHTLRRKKRLIPKKSRKKSRSSS